MGKQYDRITDHVRGFIEAQRVFFVATAPMAADGHINLSPKGLDALRVIDDETVCYLDLAGSGAETIAHARENGRVTLMFCAFDGPPLIMRIYGTAEPVFPGDAGFDALAGLFNRDLAGLRSIIVIKAKRITDSCGWGVPQYSYEGERDQSPKWMQQKGADAIRAYVSERNAVSIDGLPAVSAEEAKRAWPE